MNTSLLDTIKTPEDLRRLNPSELSTLAGELRDFIIEIVATKEGHLGASLGVVELTIALHYIFNTPDDMLVWDVGHQAYPHKLLTGRKEVFDTNRQYKGISGFPNREESIYDCFGTGHSSTSISAVLGMAMASYIQGNLDRRHIAVIGDASIASGMAFEALNHAGVSKANMLIILNDNAIGIDPSVGALKEYLTRVKSGKKSRNPNIIDALNIQYSGPIDGHDLPLLIKELRRLKDLEGPQFLHLITTKGKGLKKAEEDQVRYHAPGRFDAKTGKLLPKNEEGLPPRFQDVFGKTLTELAGYNEKITAITPAMPTGSSLNIMMKAYPDRAFDVGIAEQHAVTLAAGMATNGLIPFCSIYSTFLQRAYDQVIHDVALQNLPVIFCLDRSGLVGHDGPTHHGVFDLAYLRCIPNLTIFAPRNVIELRNILYTASKGIEGPLAIRYPRGRGRITQWEKEFNRIAIGKADILKKGKRIAVVSIGTMAYNVKDALELLTETERNEISHYDLRFLKPLDSNTLHEVFGEHEAVITIEDGVIAGGMGSALLEFAAQNNYNVPVHIKGIPDNFITHGSVKELQQLTQIDENSLAQELRKILLS
ncbi:1-deoxy-D-xylulose-5-phosphate synthase [Robertkochia sediminum]|uniref:1-deoxy-D-xylulose-5-phosphate synthase n=1 Tax=Robertkochia sediminum TaxID=2785326 RepID=UPI0019335648|nr:1-deoxy-D-xylulose-5-phosphate synthase [Robertkochia sediminum]MBL7471866.1 1-deoxy-D-xylulose-5-phosphate synthase [Robertkochia sediminum]